MDNLTAIDFELLKCIDKYEPVSKEILQRKLRKINSLDYRLEVLETPKRTNTSDIPIHNTSYINKEFKTGKNEDCTTFHEHLDIYSLTELGRKSLQDYIVSRKLLKRENWFRSIWCPILVSLATSGIANLLLQILPLVKKWVSSIS